MSRVLAHHKQFVYPSLGPDVSVALAYEQAQNSVSPCGSFPSYLFAVPV